MSEIKILVSKIVGIGNPGLVVYDDGFIKNPKDSLDQYLKRLIAEDWKVEFTNVVKDEIHLILTK